MDKVLFKNYVLQLINDIPQSVYEGAASILCIGVVVLLALKGWKKGLRSIALLAWIEYVVLIYCSTVICRVTREVRQYEFHPFWSYDRPELMVENIMNVVVFIPVGILLFITRRKNVSHLKAWILSIVSGLALSVGVETLQLIFKKGYAEVDDLMHNTLGCFIGCSLCLIIAKTWSCSMNWFRSHLGKESR